MSAYLTDIRQVRVRNSLIRFRLGTSSLKPHRLRFANGVVNLSCPFCIDVCENEVHFMFICPLYHALRVEYIPAKYYKYPTAFRLSLLLSNTNTKFVADIATYIHEAFVKRSQYMHDNCHS